MARPKKDGKGISAYIKKELVDQLDEYCERTDRCKTAVIEKALKKHFIS